MHQTVLHFVNITKELLALKWINSLMYVAIAVKEAIARALDIFIPPLQHIKLLKIYYPKVDEILRFLKTKLNI